MEGLTYHCLGLGFIAVALQTADKKKKSKTSVIVDSGIITVNGYLIQAILGLGLTLLLSVTIFKDLFYAAGLLVPMGFGQGTGQALNFGKVYEDMGFENGPAFGLSIAAIGFLVACIVGVIYLNILRKKGKLQLQLARKDNSNDREIMVYEENEAPLSQSVDKLTIQIDYDEEVFLMRPMLFTGNHNDNIDGYYNKKSNTIYLYTNNPINDILMNMPQISISEDNINISDNSFKDNLFHEYTHYVIDRFIDDNNIDKNSLPVWLEEGICEYITTNDIYFDKELIYIIKKYSATIPTVNTRWTAA
jgi:hypothetical protein